jgi:hypothetical protein
MSTLNKLRTGTDNLRNACANGRNMLPRSPQRRRQSRLQPKRNMRSFSQCGPEEHTSHLPDCERYKHRLRISLARSISVWRGRRSRSLSTA